MIIGKKNPITNIGETCTTCLLHLEQKYIRSSCTIFLSQTHAFYRQSSVSISYMTGHHKKAKHDSYKSKKNNN